MIDHGKLRWHLGKAKAVTVASTEAGAWACSEVWKDYPHSQNVSSPVLLYFAPCSSRAAAASSSRPFLDFDFGTTGLGSLFPFCRCCFPLLHPHQGAQFKVLAGSSNAFSKMPPSALFSRPLALTGLHCLIFLCIISLSSSLEVFSPPTLAGQPGRAELFIKRTWESEQGPFSDTPPQDSDIEEDGELAKVDTSTSDSPERLGIPGLGNPLPPLNSIVASVLSGSGVTVPIPGLPTPPVTSGDFFSSVISILSGAPTAVPTSHGGNGAALGGLLSALSQVTPVSVVPTASPGLLPAFDVLGGVAAALDNVLGSSEDNDSLGGGLLGQLSANIVAPLASIAADQASILSDPSAALDNLQSHVSSVMDSLPSAVAAGIQLTSNVGGKIAGVLNLTTEVLDVAPEVLAGVADGLGSVLGAGREMASRLPAAALSAVDQVESVLTAGPHVDGDLTGVLGGLKNKLSSAIANAVPEVTSLAAAVEGPVIDALPPVLQGPVQGVLTSLQTDVSGLLCQVSDVISGTAIIFNVPCGSVSSIISDTGDPGAKTSATAPLVVSATITVGEPRPLVPTPTSAISRPPLASLLSSLGSSLATAETTSASVIDPAASSALYGLSSLFSQISGLSLTATDTPSTPLLPPAGELFVMSYLWPALKLTYSSAAVTECFVRPTRRDYHLPCPDHYGLDHVNDSTSQYCDSMSR